MSYYKTLCNPAKLQQSVFQDTVLAGTLFVMAPKCFPCILVPLELFHCFCAHLGMMQKATAAILTAMNVQLLTINSFILIN